VQVLGAQKLHSGREHARFTEFQPIDLADLAMGLWVSAPFAGKAHQLDQARLTVCGAHDCVQIRDGTWVQLNAKLLPQLALERGLWGLMRFDFAAWKIPMLVLADTDQQQLAASLIDKTGASKWQWHG
jgi:hypothetical protein